MEKDDVCNCRMRESTVIEAEWIGYLTISVRETRVSVTVRSVVIIS